MEKKVENKKKSNIKKKTEIVSANHKTSLPCDGPMRTGVSTTVLLTVRCKREEKI